MHSRLFEPYASFPGLLDLGAEDIRVSLHTSTTLERKQSMEKGRYRITAEVEVTKVHSNGVVDVQFPDGHTQILRRPGTEFEQLSPAEPPNGSVVLDRDGDAWQRAVVGDGERWGMAGSDSGRPWKSLVDLYGPVKVIHVPGEDTRTP